MQGRCLRRPSNHSLKRSRIHPFEGKDFGHKSALVYNDWLTLENIPTAAHDYRLGNRSALDWIVDQYRVEHSKENPDDVLSDPNRADDEEYIVRLVGQVIIVSVETMKLVQSLPSLGNGTPDVTYTQADLDSAHIYVAEDSSGAD